MRISENMNVSELKGRMGAEATMRDAYFMRDLLSRLHDGEDTANIPEDEWVSLCAEAAEMEE